MKENPFFNVDGACFLIPHRSPVKHLLIPFLFVCIDEKAKQLRELGGVGGKFEKLNAYSNIQSTQDNAPDDV